MSLEIIPAFVVGVVCGSLSVAWIFAAEDSTTVSRLKQELFDESDLIAATGGFEGTT